ncbi:hypothetical protein F5Y02DRAFT_139491 [Annulohypoxylon stygium]|nr:hypothetical protein F5Y02DRAFT_139491 [Annulohypoxylon stygium]
MKGYILVAALNKAFQDVDLAVDIIERNQLPGFPNEDVEKYNEIDKNKKKDENEETEHQASTEVQQLLEILAKKDRRIEQLQKTLGSLQLHNALPKPQECQFRTWKDKDGNDLPSFTGVGPGDIILPDNMNPYKHILPVKDKLEQWLNVKIHFEAKSAERKHNVIQIRPSSNIQDAEITASDGTEAFYILASWVFKMIETEMLIPALDYVRDFKKNRNTCLNGKIKKMLAPIEGQVVFPKTLKGINSWNDRKAYTAAFAEAQDIRRRGLEPAINEKWDKLWQDDASKCLAANDLKQPPTLTDMTTRLKAIVLDPITPSALGMTDRTLFNAAVRSCEHVASVTTHRSLPGDLTRLKRWSRDVWAEFDVEARKIAGRMRAPEQEQVKRTKY